MMTIVTHVHLKEGVGREWDAAMRTRLSAAKKRPGWVGGQLLRQSDMNAFRSSPFLSPAWVLRGKGSRVHSGHGKAGVKAGRAPRGT